MRERQYQRRKQDRPAEIVEAAFETFANRGYNATHVDDVAKQAGVSKGLLYLYFESKEDLFKAVIRTVVVQRVKKLSDVSKALDLPVCDFLEGPFATFMKKMPDSPMAVVIRLMISEGHKHPDLVDYYHANVVAPALDAITDALRRGVASGELRDTAISDVPHILIAPAILSVLWRLVFVGHDLDVDKLVDTNIQLIVDHIRSPGQRAQRPSQQPEPKPL